MDKVLSQDHLMMDSTKGDLPRNKLDLDSLRPILMDLCKVYRIPVNPATVRTRRTVVWKSMKLTHSGLKICEIDAQWDKTSWNPRTEGWKLMKLKHIGMKNYETNVVW